MGTLKAGATYIYERANGVTYAREAGADASTRIVVGHDYDPRTDDGRPLHDHIADSKLWGDIRRKAKTHPGLAAELERVIMFYKLLEEEDAVAYHPV